MPVFVAATGMSVATASICATTIAGSSATQAVTPTEFCAVTAVIARGAVDAVRGERAEVRLDARRRRRSRSLRS